MTKNRLAKMVKGNQTPRDPQEDRRSDGARLGRRRRRTDKARVWKILDKVLN